jgi:hypothetical protein
LNPADFFLARVLVFDGQLGVVAAIAHPQSTNRALAFFYHSLVSCVSMLTCLNNLYVAGKNNLADVAWLALPFVR